MKSVYRKSISKISDNDKENKLHIFICKPFSLESSLLIINYPTKLLYSNINIYIYIYQIIDMEYDYLVTLH